MASRRWWVLLVAVSSTLGIVGPALAQVGRDAPPSTLTLDRMDAATRVGIQTGFDKMDSVSIGDGFGMRFEMYGQHVLSNRTVGFYGQLPISHVFDFSGSDATGMGNLDVGAFFLPFEDSTFILRTGLALPTASGFDDEGIIANFLSVHERMTDFLLIAPEYTTVRLGASTVQESGMAFFRADFGLDLALDKPSGGRGIFFRANVAGGVRTPVVDLSAELVNIAYLDGSAPGGLPQRFLHTFSFGFHTRGPHQLYGGLVLPLDDDIRGEIWVFSLGYQFARM